MDNTNISENITITKITHCEACKRKFKKREARYGDLGESLLYCQKCYMGK